MKTIVAFDFDGTITRSDSLIEFIRFAVGTVRFILGLIRFAPILIAYKLGLYPNNMAKERVFSYFFKRMNVRKFDFLCRNFAQCKRDSLIRPQAISEIKSHITSPDTTVVIISASIENWVYYFVKSFGVKEKNILCTKIEIDEHNKLTGRFLSQNCYGAEKVKRLLEKFPDRKDYNLIAYGDSRGDKELLNFANKCFYKPFR